MNLQELLKRKAEIREMLADETRDLNLDDLEKELREINEKIEAHERRSQLQQQATDIVNGNPENRTIDTFNNTIDENENQDTHEAEKRGLDLLENRAITVASGDLVLPKHTAKDIKGTFMDKLK